MSSVERINIKASYKNIEQYMNGYRAHYGILLVIDNKERTVTSDSWDSHLERIEQVYRRIPNLEVIGLECITA